ncbi:hypothetical protein NW762_011188 [Fusarium torreyae]|uniref:Uncharacterized protein n=1 Tax=Fusarium torreyae TaxID=1237075 RepID=A0A9W8RST9_9HYPO|nr:hypothetical protein NW762_011188 [Fusarium torreyae]
MSIMSMVMPTGFVVILLMTMVVTLGVTVATTVMIMMRYRDHSNNELPSGAAGDQEKACQKTSNVDGETGSKVNSRSNNDDCDQSSRAAGLGGTATSGAARGDFVRGRGVAEDSNIIKMSMPMLIVVKQPIDSDTRVPDALAGTAMKTGNGKGSRAQMPEVAS